MTDFCLFLTIKIAFVWCWSLYFNLACIPVFPLVENRQCWRG